MVRKIPNCTFFFQVGHMKGTAFWISPNRALTAHHTIQKSGMFRNVHQPITMHIYSDGEKAFIESRWLMKSYVKQETERHDIVVIELQEQEDSLPITPTGFAQVDWFGHENAWWYNQVFSTTGFIPSSREDPDGRPFPDDPVSFPSLRLRTGKSGQIRVSLRENITRDYGGMSGAPLFWSSPDNFIVSLLNRARSYLATYPVGKSQVVGCVCDYKRINANNAYFVCAQIAYLAEYWEPLKKAVTAYKEGKRLLSQGEWKNAKTELEKSRVWFGDVYCGQKGALSFRSLEIEQIELMMTIAKVNLALEEGNLGEATEAATDLINNKMTDPKMELRRAETLSRVEAGKRTVVLYEKWSRPEVAYSVRALLNLSKALNLHDYVVKNKPPGGPKWWHHPRTLWRGIASGFEEVQDDI